MHIKSLTIFCSSSNKLTTEYYKLSKEIGEFLATKSIKLIYGGGNVGMMGEISKSCYNNGGEVIGIIPNFLINKEKKNTLITKTIIVKNMSERKKKLFELGDAFLILPGGSGTIEEAADIISWKFLGIHKKNIIIFNYKSYWNYLYKIYENSKNKNFGKKNLQSITLHVRSLKQFTNLF